MITDAPAAPMVGGGQPRRAAALDDDDDDDDDDAVTPLLAVDETVLVGSNKHVAKVERATKPGDDVCSCAGRARPPRGIDLSEVERLDRRGARRAGRRRRRAEPPRRGRRRAARRARPAVEPKNKSRFTGVYRGDGQWGQGQWRARIECEGLK